MAPINATDVTVDKAFVTVKKSLPEVETESGNGSKALVYFLLNHTVGGIKIY